MTSKTILIVEDDLLISEGYSFFLRDEGYNVLQAENGKIALDILSNNSNLPDLILLDLRMPVMDGIAFRTEQLRNPSFSQIPVIVSSGNVELEKIAKDLGVTLFLPKPASLDNLQKLVKGFFEGNP